MYDVFCRMYNENTKFIHTCICILYLIHPYIIHYTILNGSRIQRIQTKTGAGAEL